MKRVIAALAVIIVAAAATWWIDTHHAAPRAVAGPAHSSASSCSAAPLTRDQAIQRAQARLGKFSTSLGFHERFTEPSARFDDDSRSWIVTFRSPECMVITDPNGVATTLTYKPRGWLASRSTAGETTAYRGGPSDLDSPEGFLRCNPSGLCRVQAAALDSSSPKYAASGVRS